MTITLLFHIAFGHFIWKFPHFLSYNQYVVKLPSTTRLLEDRMQRQGLGRGKSAFKVTLEAISVAGV